MHRYYRYVFLFGRGKDKIDLHGRGVDDFWNDIYDAFDLQRKMKVEKVDGSDFKIYEIKRLFKSLAEDMSEDMIELDVVITPKYLEFINLGEFDIFDLDCIETGVRRVLPSEDLKCTFSGHKFKILKSDKMKVIFVLLLKDDVQEDELEINKTELDAAINEIGDHRDLKLHLITDLDLSADAEKYTQSNHIEVETGYTLLQEINLTNLKNTIQNYKKILTHRFVHEFQLKYPDRIDDKRYKELKYCILQFNKASSEKPKRFVCWYNVLERVLTSKVRDQIFASSGVTEKNIKNAKKIMNAHPLHGSRHEGRMTTLRLPSKDEVSFCSTITKKLIDGWIATSGIND